MRRADRLFVIVQYLRSRRLTTARWLADRLEVSLRTVYRDIQDLCASGVPIEGEAGVGYVLRQKMDLPPLQFDRRELAALGLGLRFVLGRAPAPLSRAASTALAKVRSVLPEDLLEELEEKRVFVPVAQPSGNRRFAALDSAIQNGVKAFIRYRDEKGKVTRRTIHPLAILYWDRAWTLVAWCELRKDFRQFRLERIRSMRILEDRFSPGREERLAGYFQKMTEEYGVAAKEFDPESG